MRLLLLADTHVPLRARQLPDRVWAEVAAADLVVHAGDWVCADLLDELEERSAALLACYGNNDGPELRRRLPEVATAELEGLRVGVVHETGPKQGREERMRAAHPELGLLVFGHSHIPWDTTHEGLRLLNPGSPTDRRRQPSCTYLTLELRDGEIRDVRLHELPRVSISAHAVRPPGEKVIQGLPDRGEETMAKYMPIMRPTDAANEAFTGGDFDLEEILEMVGRFNEELIRAGVLLAAEGLDPDDSVVVDFTGETPVVSDGPYGETKELFNGYYVLDVASREEAVEWAKRAPLTQGTRIEIRRITTIDEFPQDNEWVRRERAWREATGQL